MAGTPLKNLQVFRKLRGKDALDKVYLTTTMWDEIESSVGERRLDELKAGYWKAMISQGAQIAFCRSDDDSPKRLFRQILARDTLHKALLTQDEMAEQKMELKQTATGQQLYSQLEALVEKQMDLLRRIDKERKGVANAEILEDLQTEYSELRAQIDDRLRQIQELKLLLRKRLWTRISKVR